MKIPILITLVAMLVLVGCRPQTGGEVRLEDLPAPAQQTVQAEAAGAEIASIEKETENGRTVYQVTFRQDGENPKIWVAEDGAIVRDSRAETGITREPAGAQPQQDQQQQQQLEEQQQQAPQQQGAARDQ